MRINWILVNKIALGDAPLTVNDLNKLKINSIKSVLTLCSEEELKLPKVKDDKNIKFERFPLPDHKHKNLITLEQINSAIFKIEELLISGPCFIHCYAGVERSPLICIAWLIKKENITLESALRYIMGIHKGTNPLQSQLNVLKKL